MIEAIVYSAMHAALAQYHADLAERENMRAIGLTEKEIFMIFENRRLERERNAAVIEAAEKSRPRGIGIFL